MTPEWSTSLRDAWPPADPAASRGYADSGLATTVVQDACRLPQPGTGPVLALVLASGPADRLNLVPVTSPGASWRRARAGDGVAEALVRALHHGTPLPSQLTARLLGPVPEARGETAIEADQTNESVVVGDAVVVKWLREPAPAPQPAVELLAHLAEVGFHDIPQPYGHLTWRLGDSGGELVTAFVDAYLPGAVDGWDWCVAGLLEHLEGHGSACPPACPAAFSGPLGALTGRLHAALATPSSVLPLPVSAASVAAAEAWHRSAFAAVEEALALTPAPEHTVLAALAPRMRAVLDSAPVATGTPVLRVHGDLHVGQVLRWREGLAVIDFDGNPVLADGEPGSAAGQPAARDVAQMLRSLDHVARVVDRRTDGRHAAAVESWVAGSRDEFLDAYRAELATAGQDRLLDDRLLASFEVEQLCRELIYAGRFLPRWRYAPMAALTAMFAVPQ